MTSIGIRVHPQYIFYAIIEKESSIIHTIVNKIVVPKFLDSHIPEKLRFIRTILKDTINEYNVNVGCIRISESVARNQNILRIYFEGVIQEMIASSSISKYYVGQISSISKKLGIPKTDFKLYADGKKGFPLIDNWGKYNQNEERESIMAALSAMKL